MAKPDVRVRLSAEGVQEVVGALKRIQAEGQKAGQKTAGGFRGLNSTLGFTRNLLGGLGLAVGFVTFKRLITGSIEAADQINKLGAKVGATTENLSALSLVARTSDADLNQVGSALIRMNKNIGDAAAGIPTAVGFLRDLGLGLRDFKGKDSVQTFELISKRLFSLEDQLMRNRIAIGLFGRSGAQLMPTMKALADEGLAAVIKRAEQLGVLIDRDLAAASEKIKDDVEILKMQSEAIGIRFVAGFGPQMSQALQAVSGDLNAATDAWRSFGNVAGFVLKWILAAIGTAVDYIATWRIAMVNGIIAIIDGVREAVRGNISGMREIFDEADRAHEELTRKLHERTEARFALALDKPPIPETGREGLGVAGGEDGAEAAELAARRAQAKQAELDRELGLIKAAAKLRTKAEQREFETGLQNVTTYYADRRKILNEAYDAELKTLEAKRALLDAETDPARRMQEEAKIEIALRRLALDHEEAIADLTQEELDTVRDLANERVELEQRLLEMQGKRIEAARLGFEEEIRQADELLKKQGASDAERAAKIAELRTALEAGADFEEAKTAAETALSDLGSEREKIRAQVDAGLMSAIQGENELLAIEQTRLETLRELAEAMLAAAEATGDPEKIAQAREFSASIEEIGYNIQGSTDLFAQFKTTALDSTTSALAEFFDTGISGSKNLKQAFKGLAASILADLKRLASQMLASQFMKWIGGFFSGGGQVDADFIGPMPAARGGLVLGPGTGTSDSILAALSRREFVTRAWAVDQPGVLEHLRAINRHGARALRPPFITPLATSHFAEGGLVDAAAGQTSGASGELDGRLLVGLEDGLIAKELSTPAGQRIVLEVLKMNRRAARATLGI